MNLKDFKVNDFLSDSNGYIVHVKYNDSLKMILTVINDVIPSNQGKDYSYYLDSPEDYKFNIICKLDEIEKCKELLHKVNKIKVFK